MKNEILKKLEEHDQRFNQVDKRLDSHDMHFDQINKRFDTHDKKFDLLAEKLLEHDERLENIEQNMATKDNIREITGTLDVLVGYAKKNENEILFMGQRLTRTENDIAKIKPLVGLK